MYPTSAAIRQHIVPKQVKSRSSFKLCTAAAACQNNLGLSDLSSASLFTLYLVTTLFAKFTSFPTTYLTSIYILDQ